MGAAAFSGDGQTLALIDHPASIKLLHGVTCDELATLTSPFSAGISCLCFSPDAECLAARTTDGHVLVWDLARIQDELGRLELSW